MSAAERFAEVQKRWCFSGSHRRRTISSYAKSQSASMPIHGKILKNSAIGATLASAGVFLLFATQGIRIDLRYLWPLAMLVATVYGYLAVHMSIYGQGSHTGYKWKNALVGLPIVVASLVACVLAGAAGDTISGVGLATGLSIVISDALSP
jgi:hypothetical protein